MNSHPVHRRSTSEIARDRKRIGEMYLAGELQADIGEALGLSQSTISRDIRALQEGWLRSSLVDFNEAKAREIAKVDNLERIYHAAWLRSCEDAETTTSKAVQAKGQTRKEAIKTAKGQAGDPRFLSGLQWCIEKRCKLWGLDAPERHELGGPGGKPLFDLSEWKNKQEKQRQQWDQATDLAEGQKCADGEDE